MSSTSPLELASRFSKNSDRDRGPGIKFSPRSDFQSEPNYLKLPHRWFALKRTWSHEAGPVSYWPISFRQKTFLSPRPTKGRARPLHDKIESENDKDEVVILA